MKVHINSQRTRSRRVSKYQSLRRYVISGNNFIYNVLKSLVRKP